MLFPLSQIHVHIKVEALGQFTDESLVIICCEYNPWLRVISARMDQGIHMDAGEMIEKESGIPDS